MTIALSIPLQDPTDGDLLARYTADPPDHAAFTELVHRHIHWLYAAALRITHDPAHAEDVTQAVLFSLARKAPELAGRQYLGGWLHEACRYAATTLLREERRRKERERVIARQTAAPREAQQWEEIQPHLDRAIARLPAPDRDAIVLRFLQRKSHEEIGALLGITAEAARKRVARALERLRHKLGAEGSAAALGAVLVAGPAVHAPSHLVTAVLFGNMTDKAALLAKGVILMKKAVAVKLALAVVVLTVSTGLVISSISLAQEPKSPQAVPAPAPAAAEAPADAAAPAVPTPAVPGSSVNVSSDGVLVTGGGGGSGQGAPFIQVGPGRAVMVGGGGGGGTIMVGGGGFGGPGAGFGGVGGASVAVTAGNGTVTRHINDGSHDITIQTAGNATTVQVKDANGKELYNGPMNSDADRAKIPADVLPLIDQANRANIAVPAMFGAMRPQQVSLDSIKQQLGATDAEWTDLQDRIQLIMTLQRYLGTGSAMPARVAAAGADAQNPIAAPAQELTTALADKSTKPEDLESKVTAVREARQQVEESLAKNRQKLESAVTARQKAVLVNVQILE